MIYYKLNILEALKKAGYNTTIIRKNTLIPETALTSIRHDKPISWSTLEKICDLLNCQPGDIIGSRHEEPQITMDEQKQEQDNQEEADYQDIDNKEIIEAYQQRYDHIKKDLDAAQRAGDEFEINYLKKRLKDIEFQLYNLKRKGL